MNVSKALVVDDSKVVRVMFKRMLEARGLGVDTAASGQEALDYLKTSVPDLVFMDYMMTGADGYEVTAMIAGDPTTSSIPVIMCTANDTPKDRARADACGAIGFLTKPIGDGALDALLKELRDGVAAPRPLAGSVPAPAAAVAPAVPTEEIFRAAERVAHEAAEKYLREAIGTLSATSEQASRSIARDVAAHAAQEALASWRMEAAKVNEQAETAAMAAAERVAQTLLQQAVEDVESSRRSTETIVADKLKEALATVSSTAERVARATLDSAKSEIEDASRKVLDSARADLHENVRMAAEAAVKPAAETTLRAMADDAARHSLAATGESDAALRNQWEQHSTQASAQMAQALAQHAADTAAARLAAETAIDEKVRRALADVSATAERVAREAFGAARASIKDEAREDVATGRPDFEESVRAAAEAAAKPVAEAAATSVAESAARSVAESTARAVAEQMANASLAAASENEAALRSRLEQGAIAAAEQAARSFVQRAGVEADAARVSAAQSADEKLRQALATVESTAATTMLKTLESAKAEIGEASRQVLDSARAELVESVRVAAESAAKPVAEAAAREVIEQVARETLAAAMQEEVAARMRVEQSAIAVVERVGRELVQLAFSAAAKQAATAAAQDGSPAATTEARTDAIAPHPALASPRAEPKARLAVVPWLAALTLAVLYLLVRTFR
ncbi:MAG: response regulator [Betaproteobacteria bacterium]